MKAWGILKKDNRMINQATLDLGYTLKSGTFDYEQMLFALCEQLDLSRPVLLSKHMNDLSKFSLVTFKAADFIEKINFDAFVVQVFFDKKDAGVIG